MVARIAGQVCGQGQVQQADGQLVYSLNVRAATAVEPGCGMAGRQVELLVADVLSTRVAWDNRAIQRRDPVVGTGYRVFLPLVRR
ncbi:MAG: hypothetical protein NZ699_16550 [Roseiflexus sp.]|nr:hypothetical protein [Roseiflexus sp.]MCS7290733.1 hypothetical protein [Roseiflexus sp.]MDW8147442.1 hypothetical protein [Roseiflexaceae bacterium]MDW8233705.1 hypothetical protein [Roseiflexaceae bacterium]